MWFKHRLYIQSDGATTILHRRMCKMSLDVQSCWGIDTKTCSCAYSKMKLQKYLLKRAWEKKCHTFLHHKHAAHLNFMRFSVVFSLKMSDTFNCSIFNKPAVTVQSHCYILPCHFAKNKIYFYYTPVCVGLSYNFIYKHWILCL